MTLPKLAEMLAAYGIAPDKRLGQHFLLDLNICRKIARLAELNPEEQVLEVGPGPGGLTRALLESGVRVTAVEKDARFLPLLKAVAEQHEGRLIAIHADALKIDEAGLVGTGASIVANLPYNVASPLLVRWLTGPLRPRAMTLMFQAEVARRITAAPGADDYGRLAIVCQALAEPTILMTLPARAFTPPPKVDSAVVRLVPRPDRPAADLVADLQRLTAAAFGQRRKMLRSSLKALGGPALCEVAGIDPNARAETVPVAGFLAMAAEIKRFSPRAP